MTDPTASSRSAETPSSTSLAVSLSALFAATADAAPMSEMSAAPPKRSANFVSTIPVNPERPSWSPPTEPISIDVPSEVRTRVQRIRMRFWFSSIPERYWPKGASRAGSGFDRQKTQALVQTQPPQQSPVGRCCVVLSRFSSGFFRAMFAMKETRYGNEIHRKISP